MFVFTRLLNFVENLSEYFRLCLYGVTYSVNLSRIPLIYGKIGTLANGYVLILTSVSDISGFLWRYRVGILLFP